MFGENEIEQPQLALKRRGVRRGEQQSLARIEHRVVVCIDEQHRSRRRLTRTRRVRGGISGGSGGGGAPSRVRLLVERRQRAVRDAKFRVSFEQEETRVGQLARCVAQLARRNGRVGQRRPTHKPDFVAASMRVASALRESGASLAAIGASLARSHGRCQLECAIQQVQNQSHFSTKNDL